jgi:hypothetical protein
VFVAQSAGDGEASERINACDTKDGM